jgi:hypothetical protein
MCEGRSFLRAGLLAVALLLPAGFAHCEPDSKELLESSDHARGGELPGLMWDVAIRNSGTDADDEVTVMRIKANSNASLGEIREPLRSKGVRILQVERNMWMSKPGLVKPVAISPRQRLTGQAAIGDIATTNYVRDYSAHYVKDDVFNNIHCHVLDLTSATNNTTYDRIQYWVSVDQKLAVHAEFYSLSGKRLKSADFEYDNHIILQGNQFPFVSRMFISDELTTAKTEIKYDHVVIQPVTPETFDPGNLQ